MMSPWYQFRDANVWAMMMMSPKGGIYTTDIKRENYDRGAAFDTQTAQSANLILGKKIMGTGQNGQYMGIAPAY